MSSKYKQKIEYLSLAKAAEFCDYSQDYLSLRARSGKLKAKKLGRNWYTTREWLNSYLTANGKSLKCADDGKQSIKSGGESRIPNPESRNVGIGCANPRGMEIKTENVKKIQETEETKETKKLKVSDFWFLVSGFFGERANNVQEEEISEEKIINKTPKKISFAEFTRIQEFKFPRKLAFVLAGLLVFANIGIVTAKFNGSQFANFAADALDNVASGVSSIKYQVLSAASEIVNDTENGFANIRQDTKNGIVRLASGISEDALEISSDTKTGFSNQISNIKYQISKIEENIADAGCEISGDFAFAFKEIASKTKRANSKFASKFRNMGNGVKNARKGVADAIAEISGDAKLGFANLRQDTRYKIQDTKNGIVKFASGISEDVLEISSDTKFGFTNALQVPSYGFQVMSSKMRNELAGVAGDFNRLAGSLKDGFGAFGETRENFAIVSGGFRNTASRALEFGAGAAREIAGDFEIGFNSGKKSAARGFAYLRDSFKRTGSEIAFSFRNSVSAISGSAEDSANRLVEISTEFASKTRNKITYAFSRSIAGLAEMAKNQLRNAKNKIVSVASKSAAGLAEISADTASQLRITIKKMFTEIAGNSNRLASSVIDSLKTVKIKTKTTVKEYARGSRNIAADAYDATASVWNGIKNGLHKTVDFVLSPWRKNDTELAQSLDEKIAQMEKDKQELLENLQKASEEDKSLLDRLAEEDGKNSEFRNQKPETRNPNPETGNQKPETGGIENENIKANSGQAQSIIQQMISYNALDNTKLPLIGGTITGALNVEGALTGGRLEILGDSTLQGGLAVNGSATLSTLTVTSGSIFEGNIYAAGGVTAGNLSIDSAGNLRVARIYQENAPLYITSTGSGGNLLLSAGRAINIASQQTIVDGNFDVLKGISVRGANLRSYEDLIVANTGEADKITRNDDTLTAYIEGDAEIDGNIYADSNLYVADNLKIGDGTPSSASLAAGSKSMYVTGDLEIDGTLYSAAFKTPYANTLTVAKSGAEYSAIQTAINACYGTDGTDGTCGTLSASNPALIKVMPGVYDEAITMHDYIDIKSAGGYQSAVITQADNASAVVTGASNSTIEGFTISATGTPAAATVSIGTTSPNIIKNKITTAAAATYYAVDISDGSPLIEQNIIGDGVGSRGLRVSGTGSPRVSYNTFYNTAYDLASTGTGTIFSAHNTFKNSAATNIYVASGATLETDHDNYKKISNAGTLVDLTETKEYAVSGADEAVGEAVYISGADTVDEARANSAGTMPAIGIIVKKISATRALVKTAGSYYDSAAPFAAGSTYYVSAATAGAITAAMPPENAQIVGYAKSSSELLLVDPNYDASTSGGTMDYHNVLTVASTNSTYTSIQSAIDACYGTDGTDGDCGTLSATNGALIRVMPGTYSENITMYDWIDVVSSAGSEVTIISQTTSTVATTANNSRLEGFTLNKTTDNTNAIISVADSSPVLEDLSITGGGTANQIVISITSGSPDIKKLDIRNCLTGVSIETGSPIISDIRISSAVTGIYQNGNNSASGTRISYSDISTTGDDIITGAASSTIYTNHNTLRGTGDNFHVATGTTVESNNDEHKKANVNATGTFADLTNVEAYTEAAETVAVGDAIYIDASGNAAEAKADSETTMMAIGMVVKETGSTVYVKSDGVYYDNGVYGNFTINSPYYISASSAGTITSTKPAGEISQAIGRARSANELILIFDNASSGGGYDNVITVAKKGGDYASIQSAIDACYGTDGTDGTCGTLSATNGAVVNVMPGNYSEAITMRAFIDVVAIGGSDTTVIAQSTATIIVGASNCRLQGFTLSKTTDNTNPIISAGATSGTYENLYIAGAGVANQTAFSITSGSPKINNARIDNVSAAITTATGSPTIVNANIFPSVTGAVGVNHTGASGTTTIRNSRIAGTVDIYASGSGATISSHSNLLVGTTNFNVASGATINSYKDSYTTVTQVGTFNQKDYAINSAIAALTVQQDSTGNIVDFKDGSNSLFTLADGGQITAKPSYFDYVYNFDGTATYTNNTAEAKTSGGTAFAMLAAEASSDDIFYVGLGYKFNSIYVDNVIAGSGVTLAASYYNGATWAALAITDGTSNLTADGAITFTAPSDWTANAVNSQTKYWVRFTSTGTTIATAPTAYSVSPTTGTRLALYSQNGDSDPALYVSDKGKIGIGTSNPESVFEIATASPSKIVSVVDATNLAGAHAVDVDSKRVYIASASSDTLCAFDASVPENLSLISCYDNDAVLNGPYWVKVIGKYAYVVGYESDNLAVLDVSNPSSMTVVGSYASSTYLDGAYKVVVAGKYAYVSANAAKRLTIIDISNPANPTLAGSLEDLTNFNGINDIYVRGKYAYISAHGASTISIVDISNPASPARISGYSNASYTSGPHSIYVSGKYAYVGSQGNSMVTILDVSDSANTPTYVGNFFDASLSETHTLEVYDKYIYVNGYGQGKFMIIDASDPTSPTLEGVYQETGWKPTGFTVKGNIAYVAAWDTKSIALLRLSGASIPMANIGNIQSEYINILNSLDVNNSLFVGNGINISSGGIQANGASGIFGNSAETALTVAQNSTGMIANFKDGTTSALAILDGGNIGINTTGPDRKLDILDASNPQLRLTQADGTVYSEFKTDASGDLSIITSGDEILLDAAETIKSSGALSIKSTTGDLTLETLTSGNFVVTSSGNITQTYAGGQMIGAASDAITLGNAGDTLALTSSDWAISATGAMTGISGISNDGAYTQTGTSANTFTGTSTFSNATYSALFTGGNVGIGTAIPSYFLDITSSKTDYLTRIYNTSTDAAAGGLYIRSDGTGNLLTLNYNGTDKFVVSPTQITSSVPISITAPGDTEIAYDLLFSNPTSSNIKSSGPLYIVAGDAGSSVDLSLSASNDGYVVVDDNLIVNTFIGVGTTSPTAYLDVKGTTTTEELLTLHDYSQDVFTVDDGGETTMKPAYFDYVYNFDGGTTYTDNTTEAKSSLGTSFTIFALETSNDYFYMGLDHKFSTIYMDIATAGAGVTLGAEYYNGSAWTTLTKTDNTTNLIVDGTITFTAPTDWATVAVNSQTKYWVRLNSTGTSVTTAPKAYSVSPTTGTRLALYAQNGDSAPALRVDDEGNIGIGILNPSSKLDIAGALTFSTQTTDGGAAQISHHTNGFLYVRGGAAGAVLSDDGGINTARVADGAAGYFMVETGDGTERFRVTSTGNVGIGDSSPSAKLTVKQTGTDAIVDFKDDTVSVFTITDGGKIAQNFSNQLKNADLEMWVGGTAVAPTGWTLSGTGAAVARSTDEKYGDYAATITYGSADAYLYQDLAEYEYYQSRTVNVGAWVKTAVASNAKLVIDDGVTTVSSSYHTGGNTYEFLNVRITANAAATRVRVELYVDASSTATFDAVTLTEGPLTPSFVQSNGGSAGLDYLVTGTSLDATGEFAQNFKNLVKNSDFNGWSAGTTAIPDSWTAELTPTYAQDAATPKFGSISAQITGAGAASEGITQAVSVRASTRYTASFYYKIASGDTMAFDLSGDSSGSLASEASLNSESWIKKTYTVTTGASDTTLILKFTATADTDIFYLDGVSLTEGVLSPSFASRPLDDSNANQISVTDNSSAALTVIQNGSGNIVDFKDASTTVFTIDGTGNTTIGEATKTVAITSANWSLSTVGALTGALDLSGATVTFKPQSVSLVPEYPNSVYYADGTNNLGTLTSDYDSASYHNYYDWTSSSDNQDYDIVVRWLVPEDFSSFDNTYGFKVFNKVSDTSGNTAVDWSMKDTGNSAVSFNESTTLQNSSWTETALTYSGSPTFTASDDTNRYWVTFQIKLTADNGDTADVGEISFRYNRQN